MQYFLLSCLRKIVTCTVKLGTLHTSKQTDFPIFTIYILLAFIGVTLTCPFIGGLTI